MVVAYYNDNAAPRTKAVRVEKISKIFFGRGFNLFPGGGGSNQGRIRIDVVFNLIIHRAGGSCHSIHAGRLIGDAGASILGPERNRQVMLGRECGSIQGRRQAREKEDWELEISADDPKAQIWSKLNISDAENCRVPENFAAGLCYKLYPFRQEPSLIFPDSSEVHLKSTQTSQCFPHAMAV